MGETRWPRLGQQNDCEQTELACALAMQALIEEDQAQIEAHVRSCAECRREVALLQGLFDAFAFWRTDVLKPSHSLQSLLAHRLSRETGRHRVPSSAWCEPEWNDVAPGIAVKLLSTDVERHVAGMLVRLAPRAEYPPHTHAAIEELYVLDGDVWVDHRKLYPGDYKPAYPGTADKRVWSESGCTCFLITKDILR